MCGRYTLFADAIQIGDRFYIVNLNQSVIRPRYNIAPSQKVAAFVRDEEKQENRLGMLRWGLIPVWAKDMSIGFKMINARAETVHEKPAYKRLLKKRRCLIPASGFFEWKKLGSRKQPYHIRLKNEEMFAF
ncbi:MAG TPA: SOS response-associated peptidase, partial [Bacillales bacterium]|nr:SOS response-associated peptidase [Bacillales bacterium]